jgi:hypothetical protein
MLSFDDERLNHECEKENEQMRANNDESSSDGEPEEWVNLRPKSKRVVGRVLYFEPNQGRKIADQLPQIVEEDHQNQSISRRLAHRL